MAVTIIRDTGTVITNPVGITDGVTTAPEVMVTGDMDVETMVAAAIGMVTETAVDRIIMPTKQR